MKFWKLWRCMIRLRIVVVLYHKWRVWHTKISWKTDLKDCTKKIFYNDLDVGKLIRNADQTILVNTNKIRPSTNYYDQLIWYDLGAFSNLNIFLVLYRAYPVHKYSGRVSSNVSEVKYEKGNFWKLHLHWNNSEIRVQRSTAPMRCVYRWKKNEQTFRDGNRRSCDDGRTLIIK